MKAQISGEKDEYDAPSQEHCLWSDLYFLGTGKFFFIINFFKIIFISILSYMLFIFEPGKLFFCSWGVLLIFLVFIFYLFDELGFSPDELIKLMLICGKAFVVLIVIGIYSQVWVFFCFV